MYTRTNLEDDLIGILHNTSLDEVQNKDALYWRVARKFLAKLDPQETRRTTTISLYDGVYDYALASDVKDLIDIRPQGGERKESENFRKRLTEEFDIYKSTADATFNIKWQTGTKSLRVSKSLTPAKKVIGNLDSVTESGTWSASGDASNLTIDTLNKLFGAGSFNFDLAASGSLGHIQNTSLTAIDLTDYDELGSFFLWVYIPNSANITNFILRWGNDITTNYWQATVTTPHTGTAFVSGWNLLRFDWSGATETGTVAPATIDSFRISVTYNGTATTDVRFDYLFISTGIVWEYDYYSKFLFRTSAGTWQETTSTDSDIINLDTDSFNLFTYEVALEAAKQIQGENSARDVKDLTEELYGIPNFKQGLYEAYFEKYPSERQEEVSSWYGF